MILSWFINYICLMMEYICLRNFFICLKKALIIWWDWNLSWFTICNEGMGFFYHVSYMFQFNEGKEIFLMVIFFLFWKSWNIYIGKLDGKFHLNFIQKFEFYPNFIVAKFKPKPEPCETLGPLQNGSVLQYQGNYLN